MTDLGFIVKMVIYKCRELGNPVTETLAAYVAQTTLNKRKTISSRYYYPYRHREILLGELGIRRRGQKTR